MRRAAAVVVIVLLGSQASAVAGPGAPVAEAERLAARARALASAAPAEAEAVARSALALTADFDPVAFVAAGRKGEIVEDDFQAARAGYRRHRSSLYAALGEALAAGGRHQAAARHLRRAVVLGAERGVGLSLARSLLEVGRSAEALDRLGGLLSGEPGPDVLRVLEKAVDAAGLPSAQVEIDRARLSSALPGTSLGPAPLAFPPWLRLSTGTPFQPREEATVFYLAEATCRTCSADLQSLKRALPPSASVLVVPPGPDQDHALRQVLQIYGLAWPVLLGPGLAAAAGAPAPSVLVVARRGWSWTVLAPGRAEAVGTAVAALGPALVSETRPRPGHVAPASGRRERPLPPPPPGLLPEGLAPGEDEPAPEAFAEAVAAYRAARFEEALRLFEALGTSADGWLLPPEARLDRALCLARLGRAAEARRLLLRTGDSRFQEAVDQALERIGN